MTHIINAILLLNLFSLSSLARSVYYYYVQKCEEKRMQRSFFPTYIHSILTFFCKNLYSEKLSKQKPKMFFTFAVHRHEVRERERTSEHNASKTWNIQQHKVCRLLAYIYSLFSKAYSEEWGALRTNHEYFINENFPLSWISIRENIHKESNPFNFSPRLIFFISFSSHKNEYFEAKIRRQVPPLIFHTIIFHQLLEEGEQKKYFF